MSETAVKIFNSLLQNDDEGAKVAFDNAINSKMSDAREIRKIKLTGDIFNSGENNETDNGE